MRRNLFILCLALVTAVALSACRDHFPPGPPDGGDSSSTRPLTGVVWHLTSYVTSDGRTMVIPDSVEATITFNPDGTLGGTNSCNQYGGEYTVSGSAMTIKDLFQTEMYCSDVAQIEQAFMEGLQNTISHRLTERTLHLYATSGGVRTLNFGSDCPPPDPGPASAGIVYNRLRNTPATFSYQITWLPQNASSSRLVAEGFLASAPQQSMHAWWSNDNPSTTGRGSLYYSEVNGARYEMIFAGTDSVYAAGPYNVAVGPDGKTVAYGLENLLIVPLIPTHELWIYDGSSHRQIATDLGINATPAFSPDGSRIAYYSHVGQLTVVDVDGSNHRALTTAGLPLSGEQPRWLSWSPDGREIAYIGYANMQSTDLYVVNVETEAIRNLTNDPRLEMWPVWSPDGRTIAFNGGITSPNELCTIPADGSEKYDVVFKRKSWVELFDLYPQWSPDGSELLFTSMGTTPTTGSGGTLRRVRLSDLRVIDIASPVLNGFWVR